jgi:hypothetical protein
MRRLRGGVVVTSVEGPQGGINDDDDEPVDAPGLALPTRDPKSRAGATGEGEPPLTEVQREVIAKMAEAQRAFGKEDQWRKAFKWDLLGGIFGIGAALTRIRQ